MGRVKELSKEEVQRLYLIPFREALSSLPEVVGDKQLIHKVCHGMGMRVRDVDPQTLPPFKKGQWLRMSSPEEDLVAILRSELRGDEIYEADPKQIAFRPVRVFRPSCCFSEKERSGPLTF